MLKFDNGEFNPSVRNDKCLFFSSHFKLGCKHLWEAFNFCLADFAKTSLLALVSEICPGSNRQTVNGERGGLQVSQIF